MAGSVVKQDGTVVDTTVFTGEVVPTADSVCGRAVIEATITLGEVSTTTTTVTEEVV
jgi:beta-lactam-binding protein with PASTA domain